MFLGATIVGAIISGLFNFGFIATVIVIVVIYLMAKDD